MKQTGPKPRRRQDWKRAVDHPEGASLPPASSELPGRAWMGTGPSDLGNSREALFDSNESLSQVSLIYSPALAVLELA